MSAQEISDQIQAIVNRLLSQKGLAAFPLNTETRFLGGGLSLDSLDLAVLVTELQTTTGKDPFKSGFKQFQTVGELASLYAD
jgi:acyl carrier protein